MTISGVTNMLAGTTQVVRAYAGTTEVWNPTPTPTGIPADEIWYTSSDGQPIAMTDTYLSGVTVSSNTYNDGKGVIKFSGTLTEIPEFAFDTKAELTSVMMSDSVTTIGAGAFLYCSALSSVTIGSGVTTIGNNAFDYCAALSSVTIPDSVTTISNHAFRFCSALSSVTIGSGVNIIGDEAFAFCDALSTINYNGTMSQWGQISFGLDWKSNVPATEVHCTDGDVPI